MKPMPGENFMAPRLAAMIETGWTGDWKSPDSQAGKPALRVAQAFQPAGSGTFLSPVSRRSLPPTFNHIRDWQFNQNAY